ncbi:twitch domain-containing radical SAM protein [Halobacteriovorax sp.]|uniref:twitch domain-containing radical SAM protein n=1 Tax=Halobacteriovorax sp. TaxID=2020862 RepID=UPI00356AD071
MSCTFCPLPWTHLSTHPIGEVSLCCIADHTNSLGSAKNHNDSQTLSLNNTDINSIINSDSFKEARLKMLNGERPKACMVCYKNEDKKALSRRQEEVDKKMFTIEDAKSITLPDGEIPVTLQNLELRLGNKCNLKCTTCNPASSSSWTKEYREISADKDIKLGVDYSELKEEMFSWPERENFWVDIAKYSKDINFININGGEPMLYPKQSYFLKYLIDNNLSKNITLEYNINLSTISEEIISHWKHFKKVIIKCSIDDIDRRNEFIRYPLKWDKTVSNFKRIIDLDVEVYILQTLSIYNFLTFEEVYTTLKKLRKDIIYSINLVTEPFFLSPLSLPPSERKKKMKEVFGLIPDKQYSRLIKQFYNNEHEASHLRMFQRYNSILIKNRKNNFDEDFKKLSSILDQYL